MNEFKRWCTWIWANWETAAFIDWLKANNEKLSANKKIGFYGLDLYSFGESMNSIIEYLEKIILMHWKQPKKQSNALNLIPKTKAYPTQEVLLCAWIM